MKRSILMLFCLMLIFPLILGACKKENDNPEEIITSIKNLNSYSTDFIMEIRNDKQVVTYEGKHYYDRTLGHTMELSENRRFVYKGDKIYAHDIKNDIKYTVDKEFDEGFIYTFVEEYAALLYTNEEVKYDYKEMEGKRYQIIKLLIPGSNKNIDNASMYVDMETLLPEYVFIYDKDNNEKVKVTYKNFIADVKLDEKLFETE